MRRARMIGESGIGLSSLKEVATVRQMITLVPRMNINVSRKFNL